MSLTSFFNSAKDRLVEGAVKIWFNQNLKRYGKMTTIQIDSTARTIHVELELKGESSPLQLDVKHYQLTEDGGETFIELGEIETSREWMNHLIADFLPPEKKSFKVPGAVKALL